MHLCKYVHIYREKIAKMYIKIATAVIAKYYEHHMWLIFFSK